MSKKSIFSLLLVLVLVFSLGAAAAVPVSADDSGYTIDPDKEEILIGAVRSQTGVFAMFDQTAFGPCYRMWVDKVNADGGI
jgi:hypothetical protein